MSQIGPFIFSAVAAGEESELLVGIGNGGESLLIVMPSFLFCSVLCFILAKFVNHGMTCGHTVFISFLLLRSIWVMLYVKCQLVNMQTVEFRFVIFCMVISGESTINVIAIQASVYLPYDHRYLIQNLTAQVLLISFFANVLFI